MFEPITVALRERLTLMWFRIANIQKNFILQQADKRKIKQVTGETCKYLRIRWNSQRESRKNSRKNTFFQRFKMQTCEFQSIKRVKRGNIPLFPSEDPPSTLRCEPLLPFQISGICRGYGSAHRIRSDSKSSRRTVMRSVCASKHNNRK